ncbi:MAG: serine/threonine-protein kinase [Kofleriaceae bacterium]
MGSQDERQAGTSDFAGYQVIRKLGEGGMGRVYLARHRVLNREVVIKQVLPGLSMHPELIRRFVVEAQAAATLAHRNVVRVEDFQTGPDGTPYIVMEYLRGLSLADWIAQWVAEGAARIPISLVTIVLVQAANALAHAHARSIVHRDIKPDNLFLTAAPPEEAARLGGLPADLSLKVLDFGIAKIMEQQGGTQTGATLGTPAYMAPEQLMHSKDVDARADVYALGAVAYQLLTRGSQPWGEQTPMVQIFQRQASEPPPDARTIDPTLPPALTAVVQKAMALAPNDRYPTMAAFAQAFAAAVPAAGGLPAGSVLLQAYAPELVEGAPALTPIGVAGPNAQTAVMTGPGTPTTLRGAAGATAADPRPGTRRGLLIAAGAVGLVAAVVAVVLASGSGTGHQAASAPAPVPAVAPSIDAGPPVDPMPVDAMPVDAMPTDAAIDAPAVDATPVDARPRKRPHTGKPPPTDDRGFRDLTK